MYTSSRLYVYLKKVKQNYYIILVVGVWVKLNVRNVQLSNKVFRISV